MAGSGVKCARGQAGEAPAAAHPRAPEFIILDTDINCDETDLPENACISPPVCYTHLRPSLSPPPHTTPLFTPTHLSALVSSRSSHPPHTTSLITPSTPHVHTHLSSGLLQWFYDFHNPRVLQLKRRGCREGNRVRHG